MVPSRLRFFHVREGEGAGTISKRSQRTYSHTLPVARGGARQSHQTAMRKLIGSLLLIFSAGAFGHADDWPTAKVQNVFSENGQYFVRIIPGTSIGDTYGFSGAPKGPFARAEFYARQPNRSYRLVKDAELNNPVSPVDALVTNQGYLVTFDNWHNIGYGKIVAIYRPDGRSVRTFTAEQLYPPERLKEIPLSTSSRWWRCSPFGFVDPNQQAELYVFEQFGGTFTFKLENGAMQYHPGKAKCTPPAGPFSTSWFGR